MIVLRSWQRRIAAARASHSARPFISPYDSDGIPLSLSFQACAALALSSHRMSVAAALESDLEPFSKLQRFELNAGVSFVTSLLLFQKNSSYS